MSPPAAASTPWPRGPAEVLGPPAPGTWSAEALGRILWDMYDEDGLLPDELMLEALAVAENGGAAGAGGAAEAGGAGGDAAAPAAPANGAAVQSLVLSAGQHQAAVAPELAARLIPKQKEGLQWLYKVYHGKHRAGCCGGILADGMGLGKTVQSIALMHTLIAASSWHSSGPRHTRLAPRRVKSREPCGHRALCLSVAPSSSAGP